MYGSELISAVKKISFLNEQFEGLFEWNNLPKGIFRNVFCVTEICGFMPYFFTVQCQTSMYT